MKKIITDRRKALNIMQKNGSLKLVSEELRKDKEIVLVAVSSYGKSLKYTSNDLKDDKDIVLAAVKKDGISLQYASNELRDDKDIVLAAVKNDGNSLQYASNELRDDKEIVLAAVKNDGNSLQYASNELRDDKEIVLAAVTSRWGCPEALSFTTDRLMHDPDIAFKVAEYREGLSYLPDEYKGNFNIVRASVSADYRNIMIASKEMQSNIEIASIVAHSAEIWMDECIWDSVKELKEYIPHELFSNREFVINLVKFRGIIAMLANDVLRDDQEIALLAVEEYPYALEFLSKKIKNDPKVVLKAVSLSGQSLGYASANLRANKKIVMAAVKNHGLALKFASKDLRGDKKVVMAAFKNDGLALKFASKDLRGDKKVVMAAVKNDGRSLQYASRECKNDKNIVIRACRQATLGDTAFRFASKSIRNNFKVAELAACYDKRALYYTSEKIRKIIINDFEEQKKEWLKTINDFPFGREES